MTGPWAQLTVGYALFVAATAFCCHLRRHRPRVLRAPLVALEAMLVVQAAAAIHDWRHGAAPADPTTHAGYLATSVLLLPLATLRPRPTGGTDGTDGRDPWWHATLAVTAIVLAVISVRLAQTAGAGVG